MYHFDSLHFLVDRYILVKAESFFYQVTTNSSTVGLQAACLKEAEHQELTKFDTKKLQHISLAK